MKWKIATGLLAAALVGGTLASGEIVSPFAARLVRQISTRTEPVLLHPKKPLVEQIGRLHYMGGVSIKSPSKEFGGLSALLWEGACNRLLAASDTGMFVALEPEEDEDGQLVGIRKAWIAPILEESGRPPRTKVGADVESLSRDGGYVHVWFEQDHRAQVHRGLTPCNPETFARPPSNTFRPAGMKDWPVNGGPEAVANLGSLQVIISEQQPSGKGGREALASYGDRVLRRFTYVPPEGHDPSALDRINPGAEDKRFLAINRRFSVLGGFSVIITEFELPDEDGATVEPAVVARFRNPWTVDNFEGLAIRPEGDRRFVYIVSDDNFMFFQRTLLMKFELLPEGDGKAP